MDIRRFLGLLWARILIVIAVTAQVAVVTFLVSRLLPVSYEAQAQLVVQAGLGTGSASTDDILAAPRVGQTYAGLGTTRPVLEALAKELKLPYTDAELAARLSVDAQFDSPFINVTARDADPERAAAMANGLAEALVTLSEQPPVSGSTPDALLAVVDPAEVPDDPSSPRVFFNTLIAAGAAFALTIAVLSAIAYLDDRIRRSSDLEGIPAALLGRVRLGDVRPGRPGVAGGIEAGEAVFAGLVNHLLPGTARVSLTSPTGGRGAGTTAAGLAIAAAHLGRETILVDGNLREPHLHALFGLDNQHGFATLLAGGGNVAGSELRATHVPRLRVLPAGPVLGDPEDLLTGRRTAEVLRMLADESDLVIIATPPVGAASDAAIVSALVDSTILVVNQGVTTRGDLQAAIAGLRGVGGRILGLVLMVPPSSRPEAGGGEIHLRAGETPTTR